MKRGMFFGADELREQVPGNNFPPLVRSVFPLVGGLDFAIQLASSVSTVENPDISSTTLLPAILQPVP